MSKLAYECPSSGAPLAGFQFVHDLLVRMLTKLKVPSSSGRLLHGCSAQHHPASDVVGIHNDGERSPGDDSGVIQPKT
ncbi:MAG: hypothetical protein QOI01_5889 [Mycobacterium sp.]|jgi:hypothetical protein|nr:hypothetical protein [Mycobacterium sp.]